MKQSGSPHTANTSYDDAFSSFNFFHSRRWLSGIPYEVAFWRSCYRFKASRIALMSCSQLGKECELDNFDVAANIQRLNRKYPIIADMGCVLSYEFSNIIGGRKHGVTYLDPLALHYNKILDADFFPYPRIAFGMGDFKSAFPKRNLVVTAY